MFEKIRYPIPFSHKLLLIKSDIYWYVGIGLEKIGLEQWGGAMQEKGLDMFSWVFANNFSSIFEDEDVEEEPVCMQALDGEDPDNWENTDVDDKN